MVWIAAVGEFLGSFVAVASGLLIFWLETRRGRREEERRQARELAGILLILYDEISANGEAVDLYAQNPKLMWSPTGPLPPSESIWEDTKGRIAALAHPVRFAELVSYYKLVRILLRAREHDPNEINEDTVIEVSNLLRASTLTVNGYIREYLNSYDEKYQPHS